MVYTGIVSFTGSASQTVVAVGTQSSLPYLLQDTCPAQHRRFVGLQESACCWTEASPAASTGALDEVQCQLVDQHPQDCNAVSIS